MTVPEDRAKMDTSMKSMRGTYEGEEAFKRAGLADFEQRYLYHSLLAGALVGRFHPQYALDIGCAGGDLVYTLRELGVSAFGIDISEYAISHSIEAVRGYLQRVDVDFEPLPFDSGSMDLVTALGVIEHLQKPSYLISEVIRISKAGGIAYILTPTPPFNSRLWRILGIQRDPAHINVHSRPYWIKAFEEKGFGYIGDFQQFERKTSLDHPIQFWPGRLLVKMGPPGKWFWVQVAGLTRGTFLFRKNT